MPQPWEADIAFKNRRRIYLFISDDNGQYFSASQGVDGSYTITLNNNAVPLSYNPKNLLDNALEFATNQRYFSMVRTINYPLSFIKDGAAILRHIYFLRKGVGDNAYLTIQEWNFDTGEYEPSYTGKFDFSQKKEDPKSGTFSLPCKDNSAWGILSEKDKVVYSIDCSRRNPKAVKFLVDGINLQNKYTFQTVAAPIQITNTQTDCTIPFVLVNQDGDSSGIITKNQSLIGYYNILDQIRNLNSYFFYSLYQASGIEISGTFSFVCLTPRDPYSLKIYFASNAGQQQIIFNRPIGSSALAINTVYSANFNFTMSLGTIAVDENSIFLIAQMFGNHAPLVIQPIVTNIVISVKTKPQPAVIYGLRPLDLLQELVKKATLGRFTINSNFLKENNKVILFSGDAARGIENAKIYTSFEDFFQTFNYNFLALRNIKGDLWLEKAKEVYKHNTNIIDLGEASDLELVPAMDYYYNEIEVGSPKQDYRHPSGRLEFNSTNTFSIDIKDVDKKLNLVTKYRFGCYDIQFLIMDYQGQSTQDNSGDKSVYGADVTDELATATKSVSTFENINIDNFILEPIIKEPLDNDVINYARPIIKGIAQPITTINIYIDNTFSGNTISDAEGNWSYEVPADLSSFVDNVSTGVHVIEATFTDNLAAKSSLNITIDTSVTTPTVLSYPEDNETLYNNKPIIRGFAPFGSLVAISIDGSATALVTADQSGRWSFQTTLITNGSHTITANGITHTITVNSFVSRPLITYIGSELDGFPVLNNLPLIKGVAIPGTVVEIWIDYISYHSLGTATADSNGNWEFQVVPVTYTDILSGQPVVLAPIKNGLNIFSTSLINYTVDIEVKALKLNRPVYSSITGVIDNTVFNTTLSPKRMMFNWYLLLSAILNKQQETKIKFQTADKNGNLSTILNGNLVKENQDVTYSELDDPIALLEYANIKVNAKNNFRKTLENFNNGGTVKVKFRGVEVKFLTIGSMKINSLIDTVQTWKLLLSPDNTYTTLLNLYKNGLTITLMANEIYHSNSNSLFFVDYDFHKSAKYNNVEINEDWFENRNSAWTTNPVYIQKFQKSETIIDQITVNGIMTVTLKMFKCSDPDHEVDSIVYANVSAPVPTGYFVKQVTIDFSLYPEDQYYFIMYLGEHPLSISERVQTKINWINTFLIEARNSINAPDVFFSTGFKTILRVEGLIKKLQSEVSLISSRDEKGNNNLLYGSSSKKREIRFGTAYGLPDYLYLNIQEALTMDDLRIDKEEYVLSENEKINPSDDIDGHPLYYYNVVLDVKNNTKGRVFI